MRTAPLTLPAHDSSSHTESETLQPDSSQSSRDLKLIDQVHDQFQTPLEMLFFFFFSLHTKEEDQSILSHTNTGTFLQVSEMESKEGGENCTLYGVLKIIARTLMTVFSVGSSYGARRLFQKYSWDIDLAVKLCPGRAGPWFAAPEEGDEMLRHLEKWNCHWGWFTSWWAWQWGASAYSLQKFVIY